MRASTAEVTFVWFQRIIAIYCLLFGILYWVRLIGVYQGPLWRFDLMPLHWRVAASVLAVFFPFAGAGLWMLASWGPVIWFICAVTEVTMYAGFRSCSEAADRSSSRTPPWPCSTSPSGWSSTCRSGALRSPPPRPGGLAKSLG